MFDRVLVANRGEIAVRVIRALHELGIEAVAVYSTADRDALHVELADHAVCIGPPSAAESYLLISNVVAAAETTACDAVHPGYGFLAENAEFVRACEDNDLVFIGPPADVVEQMGDKVRAKEAMRAAGVPLVPGSDGTAGLEDLRRSASEAGFPVLLKAAAGGGGKGMRLVASEDELEGAFGAASAEAEAAFGDGSVYVEKLVSPARHVEIQVLCDAEGRRADAGRARVLDPAAPPEARRGVAVGRARRDDARGDGGDRRAGVPGDRLPQRGHVRVPRRAGRRLLLHRGQLPAPGRASSLGARRRASTSSASRSGSPPASPSRRPAARRGAGTRSRSGSTRRILPAAFSPRRGRSRGSSYRSARACVWIPRSRSGIRDPAVLRLDDREARRLGRDARRARSPAPSVRCASSRSKGSRRRATSRSTSSARREFRSGDYSTSTLASSRAACRRSRPHDAVRRAARRARRQALYLLYQWDLTGQELASLYEGEPDAFARSLAEAVAARAEALDLRISAASPDWPADRLGTLERNILRIGVYELEEETVPREVAINEAVVLAKRYATEDAARLVNGILARVAREEEAA